MVQAKPDANRRAAPNRRRTLQRVGQLLRAVEDGDDVETIRFEAIDQAIRVDDELAQVFIVVFWHDAPRARMVDQYGRRGA